MASTTGLSFGAFGDNTDLSDVSFESALSHFEAAVQETEEPVLPDEDSGDMAEPEDPETTSAHRRKRKGGRRKSKNLDSIFGDDDEDEDDTDDENEDEDEDDTESTSARRRKRKGGRRKSKNLDSIFGDDDEDEDDTDDEDEDEDDEEDKKEKEDDDKAKSESKRRRCRNLTAIAEAAEETADEDGEVDEGLEAFVLNSGVLEDCTEETGIGNESMFSGLFSSTPHVSVESLRKAAFDASEDLTDHYRRVAAGL